MGWFYSPCPLCDKPETIDGYPYHDHREGCSDGDYDKGVNGDTVPELPGYPVYWKFLHTGSFWRMIAFWNSTEMVQKYLVWPITGEPHVPALSRAGSSNGSWFLCAFLLIQEQGSSQEILSGNRWYLRPLFLFNILLAPFLQRGGISPGHFLKFQDEITWTDPVYSSF